MSDLRKRRLQRQAAIGDPSAEAAFLRERLRNGETCPECEGQWSLWTKENGYRLACPDCGGLSIQERIELAAWCGHLPAIEVSGHIDCVGTINAWVKHLSIRFGYVVTLRTALSIARTTNTIAEDIIGHKLSHYVIDKFELFISCPCEKHRGELDKLKPNYQSYVDWILNIFNLLPNPTHRTWLIEQCILSAIATIRSISNESYSTGRIWKIIKAAICDDLIRWALK